MKDLRSSHVRKDGLQGPTRLIRIQQLLACAHAQGRSHLLKPDRANRCVTYNVCTSCKIQRVNIHRILDHREGICAV